MTTRSANFEDIKRRCHGMMREDIYVEIFDKALNAPGGNFVEIGTAHGASTVCMALAKKQSGKPGKIYTFDKFASSSRKGYGSHSDNMRITLECFEHFGVADIIEVVVGDANETSSSYPESFGQIAMLMLDADGRIDRDMRNFIDRVKIDAPIVIDDYCDRGRAKVQPSGKISIDLKHRITWNLTNLYMSEEVLKQDKVIYQTWFGSVGIVNIVDVPVQLELLEYRKLIFTDANVR